MKLLSALRWTVWKNYKIYPVDRKSFKTLLATLLKHSSPDCQEIGFFFAIYPHIGFSLKIDFITGAILQFSATAYRLTSE